jgi:DHA3 family macrolide efflux protein-like MFS transporter
MRSHVLWRLLGSQGFSSLGTSMSTIALAFMVNRITGSVLHMGAVMAVSTFPLAMASWIGGALLDRYSGKNVMIVSDIVRAVLIFTMPFLARQSVLFIYLIASLIGVFSALFNPAQIKLVGELAARDQLVRSNSYLGLSRDGAELIGYLAGGVVVAAIGYTPTFMVDGATYVLSALFLIGLPRPVHCPADRPQLMRLVGESPAVFLRLWRHLGLRTNLLLALLPMTAVFVYGPNSYGLVLDVFQGGAVELGAMELAIACGAIVGGLLMSRMSLAGDKNRYVVGSLVIVGFCLFGVYFSGSLWLSIALLGIGGLANVALSIPSITMFQEVSSSEDKGRLISVRAGFGQVSLTVGYFLGGLLGELLGIRMAFLVAGLAAASLSLLIYVPYRIKGNRRANVAWKEAIATGETRAAARKVATEARMGGRYGTWPLVTDVYTEEES